MTLKQYLLLMTVGSLICWGAWLFVINGIDPDQSGVAGFLFFYISLFLSLLGTLSVIGFIIRKGLFKSDHIVFHHVKNTFRQGLIFSLAIIIAMILLQFNLLAWWIGILLVAMLFVVESVIFTKRKYSNKDALLPQR
jgi:hypothetical protein